MKDYKKNVSSPKGRIRLFIPVFFALMVSFSSCSTMILDYTLISSRTHNLKFDLTQAIDVEGIDGKWLSPGSIKEAMDKALQSAGREYDILIDGVVYKITRPWAAINITQYKVTGLAVSSRRLIATLGEEGFQDWLTENNVFDPATAVIKD